METLNRFLIAPVLATALALALYAAVPASSHAAGPKMSPVSIAITATGGTVWGTVTARYSFHHSASTQSCSTAACTLRVPKGAMLHLSQTARDTATWPFKSWQITANHHTRTVTAGTASVKVQGSVTVTAVYVVAQSSSSSGNGGGYGNYP